MPECLSEIEIRLVIRRQLSGSDLTRAESHLANCTKCRDLLAALQHELDLLESRTLDGSTPPSIPSSPSSPADSSSLRAASTMHDGMHANDDLHAAPIAKPQTIVDYQRNLTLSGLMTREELDSMMASLPGNQKPNDVATLADMLVSQQKLTPYQAEVLGEGRTRGLVLGNYVILEKLGEGGMGLVFKATHKRMKRTVALKVLPPALTKSHDAIQRFHREVEAAAKLTHPNIAAAYDADEADGIHFLVMEYVDGPNLSSYVKQAGPLGISAAVNLTLQAARGLNHAHNHGVIHRDIKPSNLLVNSEGVLKVLDMGLARLSDAADEGVRAELTQSGRVMGTVDYMAPEQAIDAKKVDHRADIYSLGCTLYYLLTGKTLSPDGTLTQKLLWHQNETIPSLRAAREDVSEKLDQIYLRMMAKKPENRFQTMAELCDELDAVLAELPEQNLALSLVGIDLHMTLPRTDRGSSRGRLRTQVDSPTRTFAPGEVSLTPPSPPQKSRTGLLMGIAGVAGFIVLVLLFALSNKPKGEKEIGTSQSTDNPSITQQPNSDAPPKTNTANNPTSPQGTSTNSPEPANSSTKKSPPPPEPPLPLEKLLSWVFQNGGTVTVTNDEGRSIEASKLSDVPRKPFESLSIRLDGSPVRDDELATLTDAERVLRQLSLAGTKLTDRAIEHLATLKRLQSLDLSKIPLTNDAMTGIGRLSELRELNLQRTAVSDQGITPLVGLSQLEKLYLADTQIGDAGVKKLENLPALREIGLNGTYVTDEGIAGLTSANPQLKIHWDGKDLERSVAQRLLAKNAKISLQTRSGMELKLVTDKLSLPRERFWVTSIDYAANSNVTDDDLKLTSELAKIASINLNGTSVTAAGLQHLHGLTSLKQLELGSLPIPKSAVDALQNVLRDCVVKQKPPRDLTVAEWAIAKKGSVTLVSSDGDRLTKIRDVEALPKGLFSLREIYLNDVTDLTEEDYSQLRDLPSLEVLNLSGTKTSDSAFAAIVDCPQLRELGLSGTNISSMALSSLARFPLLQKLYLANTKIDSDGVKQIARSESITTLSLAGTKIDDADLVELKRLTKLERLTLSGTTLSDSSLETLKQFTSLGELLVDGTEITDAGIEELKAALGSCMITANPANPGRQLARWILQQGGGVTLDSGELKKASLLPRGPCKVVKIDLTELKTLRPDVLIEKLKGATDLEELNLTATTISNAQLAGLSVCTGLKQLHLGETLVSDQGWSGLVGLMKLERLDLHGTRISGASLKALEGLTSLRSLSLATTQLTDRHLASLADMTELQYLDLTSNPQITDKGISSLERLTKLQAIGLRRTGVTDAAMGTLAKFPGLRIIDLESTTVSDSGIAQLKDLKSVQRINLNKTSVTDGALSTLATFPELRYVNLSRTKVSEGAIETLRKALPECDVVRPASTNPKDPEGGGGGGIFGS